jgi:hypothetical protein
MRLVFVNRFSNHWRFLSRPFAETLCAIALTTFSALAKEFSLIFSLTNLILDPI